MVDQAQQNDTDSAAAAAALGWVALVALVTVAARRLRASLAEEIAPHELGESEFALLWACYQPSRERLEAEGLTQSELAQALELSHASVSGLVEQLRRAGLLDGCRSTVDRRRQVWRLTERGETLMRNLLAELENWAAALDRTLTRKERLNAGDLLSRLLDGVSPSIALSAGDAPPNTNQSRRGAAA